MRQIVQNYRSGELGVLDVPVPACKPGGVLVATMYSLISAGTEMMKVEEAKLSLLGKARARPDQVRKVVDTVSQVGPVAAYRKAVSRLDSYTPLGYSSCGVVVQVGRSAEQFRVGQLVACAGNDHALHAEVNWVPTNLCVPVPDGVDPQAACFATVGAIALHGVRRAESQLGEMTCVVGLGLIGQLVVRLLVAAGVRVVGLDPIPDRRELAEKAGAVATASPSSEGLESIEHSIRALNGGLGADQVLLATGGSSNEPARIAARLARDRARVIDIGKCRLDLPWNDYYEKELDVRFSRSYGPGRYDDRYELEGVDYPAGYVRWTERRNLACFLDLLARQEVDVEQLVSQVFPIESAVEVYEQLIAGQMDGVGFLFQYSGGDGFVKRAAEPQLPTPASPARRSPVSARVRLGFIGAGNYASSMLLPHLARRQDVELAHVATTTPLSAINAQRRFGFTSASTDVLEILNDESIDAVFIVTRHHSHAALTCQALEAGKTVFVEKPLALSDDELDRILHVVASTGNDRLMVGFNRRFAPLLTELRASFGPRNGPGVARYFVNAGKLRARSWYLNADAEGSRFEGEGGHFIDTVSWWLGASPVEVYAVCTTNEDDVLVTLKFDDESVANLAYVTDGNTRHPKETFEAVAGGRVARLDNFRRTSLWSGRRRHVRRAKGGTDKGQRVQLDQFLDAVRSGRPSPISLPSLVSTTRATLAVARSFASGRPERI